MKDMLKFEVCGFDDDLVEYHDQYVCYAEWDNGRQLTNGELDALNDYIAYEQVMKNVH